MVFTVNSSTGFIYRPWQGLDLKFEIVRSGKSSKKDLGPGELTSPENGMW